MPFLRDGSYVPGEEDALAGAPPWAVATWVGVGVAVWVTVCRIERRRQRKAGKSAQYRAPGGVDDSR